MLKEVLGESRWELAKQRHILKSKLSKYKGQDELCEVLIYHLDKLLDCGQTTINIQQQRDWLLGNIDHRQQLRQQVNDQLDSMERVNPTAI